MDDSDIGDSQPHCRRGRKREGGGETEGWRKRQREREGVRGGRKSERGRKWESAVKREEKRGV